MKLFIVAVMLLTAPYLFAASSNFLNIASIISRPDIPVKIMPYAINLASYPAPLNKNRIKNLSRLNTDLVYFSKLDINNKIYYRLVAGNFPDQNIAKKQLAQMKKYYPGAWLNIRKNLEKQKLAELLLITGKKKQKKTNALPVATPVLARKTMSKSTASPGNLLEQAKQLFLDKNYPRVIAVSDKIIETGTIEQKQKAMEIAGIARERQRKFAQAIAIYSRFLKLYPESELAPKIKNRLAGLKTMRMEPKARLAKSKRRKTDDAWSIYGSFSQYYRDDIIDREGIETEEINSSLVSDINFFARRKTEKTALVIRFDGGVVNDFIDKENDSRISRAVLSYTNNNSDYKLTGGRQSRTAKGVFGRFDGLVYKGLSHQSFDYSIFTGSPVQSSFDSADTDRQFLGTSINFKPFNKVEMDVYLVHQVISELTDRQALGTEIQYRSDKGFLYSIIDYDLFYSDLNNFSAITNYRYTDKWVFNVTYDYRNSPMLTTLNALKGQSVATMDELLTLFSDDEIYQFAQDRTSKSQNLFVGSNYQIDDDRQLYLSMSLSSTEETVESAGVTAVPSSEDINLSGDYTIKGYFVPDDYTTFGMRLSDSVSSEIISLRFRSRFSGGKSFRYDPRLRLDYRQSKTSELVQYILKPSIKFTYKPNKKINFEASLGIDYSNFDLPELDDQTAYNLVLGYVYRF